MHSRPRPAIQRPSKAAQGGGGAAGAPRRACGAAAPQARHRPAHRAPQGPGRGRHAAAGGGRGPRFFNGRRRGGAVNKRFIVAGAILGTAVVVAFLLGSPMFGGYDSFR